MHQKTIKIGTTKKFHLTGNCPRNGAVSFYNAVPHQNELDGMVNSVDPDQIPRLYKFS